MKYGIQQNKLTGKYRVMSKNTCSERAPWGPMSGWYKSTDPASPDYNVLVKNEFDTKEQAEDKIVSLRSADAVANAWLDATTEEFPSNG